MRTARPERPRAAGHLPGAQLEAWAAALREAQSSRRPIAPLRFSQLVLDVEAAYTIQDINTRHGLDRGRSLFVRKVGLTSEAVQRQLGVDQPDYGMLFDDMRIEDGGTAPAQALIQPKVEGEVAFVLGADLPDADCTPGQLAQAIDYAAAALEIVDSRIEDWNIGLVDTVADNASSAMFVLGRRRVRLGGFDPAACTMRLYQNDTMVSDGAGRLCLGSPFNSALWLARRMAALDRPLRAGDIVLTGALGRMVNVLAGSRYRVEIDGLGQAEVTID